MKPTPIAAAVGLAAAALLAACASAPTAQEVSATLKASFASRGIAKVERLDQSELQRVCSEAAAAGQPLDTATRRRIEAMVLAAVKYPADGRYLGDWREGEKIAQNGRGLQFSDAAGAPNGANCYACHQLTPKEISFGNLGPSLLKYGLARGVQDPYAPGSAQVVQYTWARIWNTHAFNACSGMPRFGDAGILTEDQIRHVMALLLDPLSPVNSPVNQ